MIWLTLIGRGGQGIKSASHIVSTAAFLKGYYVQSQPIYRAERRGAPISAFIRISNEPILERGYIYEPSLIVIADESLFIDTNLNKDAILFVNTALDADKLRSLYNIENKRIITYNLTGLTLQILNKSIISVALAAVACRLIGLNLEEVEHAVIMQLEELNMQEEVDKNIELVRKVFELISNSNIENEKKRTKSVSVIDLSYHHPKISACYISVPANSISSEGWNVNKPIIDYDKCTKCMICFIFCPDSAIILNKDNYPVINYDLCKGCNICYVECPTKAIRLERNEATLDR
ncbi:MAG: 2-oxoacid:acceptor oxidoreductase family protein [Candidatus Nitrosocaldaceae archaeon]